MQSVRLVWIKRLIIFILGQFVLALGIAFSVRSSLGVSPVTSVPFVVTRITGLSLGTTTVFLYFFCMALQAVILRRDYKLRNLFQIAFTFLFGYFTDAALWLTSFLPVTENYPARFVYLALGIAFVALGVMFYLTTSLIALPTDGTVQAIAFKGRFKLHKVKIGYDCVSTALAITVSLIVMGDINGIGVGTIAASIGVGKTLGVFSRLFKEKLQRFIGMSVSEKDVPAPEELLPENAKQAC